MNNGEFTENGLVKRYLYDVTRRLPANQREDIEKELGGLIEDMLAGRCGGADPAAKDIEAVLLELGEPAALADTYRGSKRYLIGPDYYDTYVTVLKIVLLATGFGMTLAMTISAVFSGSADVAESIGKVLASIISALFQAFCWVTIAFAVSERYGAKAGKPPEKGWRPADLPDIPEKKSKIKKSDAVAGIIFGVLAIILFNAAPQLLGVYARGDTLLSIPVFDLEHLRGVMPFINTIFFLGLLKEFMKLIFQKYSLKFAALNAALNIGLIILTVIVFFDPAIWNPDFARDIQAAFDLKEDIHIQAFWPRVPRIGAGLAVFGYAVDTIAAFVKALVYKYK